jgi:hypothetical protein
MWVRIFNKQDRIRHHDPFNPKHDFKIEVPKGETRSNRHTRLRAVGVSRSGRGIAKIAEAVKARRQRGEDS